VTVPISPLEDDALTKHDPSMPLPPAMRADLEALLALKPTRNAAIVVCMREDGVSVTEWIAHHRAIGFEGILVYGNDNRDGSKRLLRLLADSGAITYIDNQCGSNSSPQPQPLSTSLSESKSFELFGELLQSSLQYRKRSGCSV
jgi:hypothetical protein